MRNGQNERERQRIETGRRAAAWEEHYEAQRQRAGEPPAPGDVFLHPRTAGEPVEWVVVERRAEDGRLLVVLLDDFPLVGSRDLALPEEALGGVANARCDLDLWLAAGELDSEQRTGRLEPAVLKEVRRKRGDIEAGTLAPTLLEADVDGDPAYLRWREGTLRQALVALKQPRAEDEALPRVTAQEAARQPAGKVLPFHQRVRQNLPALALAASALIAVLLPTGWEIHRLHQHLDAERAQAAALEDENAALQGESEALQNDLESAQSERQRLQAAYQQLEETAGQQLSAARTRAEQLEQQLEGAVASGADVNLRVVQLTRDDRVRTRRGQPYEIELGTSERRLALLLEVVTPEPYDSYRLRIVREATGEEIWRTDELIRRGCCLQLALPTVLFEPGEYRLQLYGLKDGEATELKERDSLKITR